MTAGSAPRGIDDVYELTPIQQGLLLEQLKAPDSGVYIEQLVLTFDGDLDPGAFERAWQQVVDRHPILRSSFHWREDRPPLQVVHAHARLPLEVLDWTREDEPEQRERLARWLDDERVAGFALESAPLMRITVVRVAKHRWWFVWRLSHLLMDGWSFGLAVTDFVAAYRGQCLGHEPDWNPMRPYRDYAAWWAERAGADDGRAFWRSELAGFRPPPPLDGGGSAPAPGEPSHDFVELSLADLADGLGALGRAHQLTLNTLVQGAWLIVLAQHYGTTDVACGFTMAHRPAELPGSETILGPLIATMPVREKLEPTRSVAAWLRGLGVHIAAIRQHTTLPLYEVQRLREDSTDGPLLESSVSYENMPMPDFALEETGVRMTDLRYDGRPHYPITMVIMPGEGMPLRVIYDRSRFAPEAAHRFCARLREVLTTIVEHPELTIGELWPPTSVPAPVGGGDEAGERRCLHEVVAERARTHGDVEAVSDGSERVTWAGLHTRAEVVARRLVSAGVVPGSRVALFCEPSVAMVAAMTGVFAAGAAYVPLDPGQPAERVADLLADAEVDAVLTTTDLAGRAPQACARVLVVDDGQPAPEDVVLPEPDPDRTAYVLHTSGSTGRPKGVVVTHRNVASLLGAARTLLGVGDRDVWTFAHAYTFDYSVWEIWGALGHGGRLVVVPPSTLRSPAELHRLLHDEQVTVCSLTPALFEHVDAEDAREPGRCPSLRHVVIGGDRLHSATTARWLARRGDEAPRLHNLYGVTEATVVSTAYRITTADAGRDAPLPIGSALVNQRIYVLDDAGRAVPDGASGELCVAGPAVAAGYHRRPELTAQRFGHEPGTDTVPLYRTGDVVRAGTGGVLHHLGRADTQIKVRGHRVELGEIEAALLAHPGVRSAVAVARRRGADVAVLAYAVPAADTNGDTGGDTGGDTAVLRDFLAARLPEHMVPAAIGWLDAIPTTPGGKVDERALPELARGHHTEGVVAPRGEVETALAALVGRVTGLSTISRHDRLADLGVHSVHLMRVMAAVRARWGVTVPFERVWAVPDLAALAGLVEQSTAQEVPS